MAEEKVVAVQVQKMIWSKELVEMGVYSLVALGIPFALGHPQLLVGSVVNAALILAALRLKNYQVLPIILLPSVAVLTRGLIFGPYTMLLVFTIPFIWIANSILVYGIRFFKTLKWHPAIGTGISAVLKFLFLYSIAMILIKAGILPKPFAVSFGVFQLYTALIGGAAALMINQFMKKSA